MKGRRVALALACALVPSTAAAYPSAVVFSPNGEVRDAGSVGLLAYGSANFAPSISAGASWFGAEAGLLPHWPYGSSGVSFGGLEAGFDVISPYGASGVKPVLNVKLGVVTEGRFSPSVALGVMEVSPGMPSMDFVFVAATKTLGPAGRLTIGFGEDAGDRSAFAGSFPFAAGARQSLMAAYESPLIAKRLGLVADWLGGVSEISSLYVGATLCLSQEAALGAGAFFDNDRSDPATRTDGAFFYLSFSFDALKLGARP